MRCREAACYAWEAGRVGTQMELTRDQDKTQTYYIDNSSNGELQICMREEQQLGRCSAWPNQAAVMRQQGREHRGVQY